MIGEPDARKPHVRFDEEVQETCDIAARLFPTLPFRPPYANGRQIRLPIFGPLICSFDFPRTRQYFLVVPEMNTLE